MSEIPVLSSGPTYAATVFLLIAIGTGVIVGTSISIAVSLVLMALSGKIFPQPKPAPDPTARIISERVEKLERDTERFKETMMRLRMRMNQQIREREMSAIVPATSPVSESPSLDFDVFLAYRSPLPASIAQSATSPSQRSNILEVAEKLALALVENDPHWKFTVFWDKRILLPQKQFRQWISGSGCVVVLLSERSLKPLRNVNATDEDSFLEELELAVDKLELAPATRDSKTESCILEPSVLIPVYVGPWTAGTNSKVSKISIGDLKTVHPWLDPEWYPDNESRSCCTRTIRETMTNILRIPPILLDTSVHDIRPVAQSIAERIHSNYYRRASHTPTPPRNVLDQQQSSSTVAENADLPAENTRWNPIPAESDLFRNTIPERYIVGLSAEGPDVPAKRWKETLEWRETNRVDDILDEPQEMYETIKKFYSHFYHNRTKDGRVIYYERPGKSDFVGLREAGCATDVMVRHFLFITETYYRVLCPTPDATSVNVIDASNLSVSDVAGEKLDVFKAVSKISQSHYVERCGLILVVNAGWMFRTVWGMVSPFVHKNTRAKMKIFGTDYQQALCELAGEENIPVEYGGKDTTPLGQSEQELLVLAHVRDILAKKASLTK